MGWIARFVLLAALAACGEPVSVPDGGPVAGWPEYGGDIGGLRYSPLTQITRENVSHLEVAWTYHTGDAGAGSFEATPILFEGTLYLCTPRNRVIALDAESGTERWSFDPELADQRFAIRTCRGVTAWRDPEAQTGAACAARIFTGTLDARLIAVDAATGRPCPGFGSGGSVDLRAGLGPMEPWEYSITSPPLVVRGRVVVGGLVADNQRTDAPSGVVRAFDARTGSLSWAWDPTPAPAAAGGSDYTPGTPNVWAPFSADPARGLIFAPTGNAAPDYVASGRGHRADYGSSVVALDAERGTLAWHFQTVHDDVWDYDVPAQPTLFELPGAHGPVPGLAQVTKMGHVFLLHRETGEPLFRVEERPVPQRGAPGEALSATQPFPTHPPPLHPTRLGPEDAFGFTPWDRGRCREALAAARSDGIFTPPGVETSIHFPGAAGGMNWGGAAVDSERGWLVVNTTRVATYARLIPRDQWSEELQLGNPYRFFPQTGTPYAAERDSLLSPLGVPCNPPPWGVLTSVDLSTGEIRWEIPLGTSRDLAPFPVWLLLGEIGTPNLGGPIATASGLVFIGAATDDYLRAFDHETGRELWRGRLPAGGQATPMTYRLRPDGRQYVVIAAGGHLMLDTSVGDAVVAFALP